MIRTTIVIYIIALFFGLAWAGPREDLLKLTHRPTISEIKAAFGHKLPEVNPFGSPSSNIQNMVRERAPRVIATFEKAFPGGIYAPLGRDAAFLGDVIDAFYQSLGQARVIRVNASGASLGNDAHLLKYMESLGVNLENAPNRPPFIMFDQTNFGSTSQSTRYFKVMFGACKTKGCDLARLTEDFNFLNTGSNRNMYNRNVINSQTDIYSFIEEQKKQAIQSGAPTSILSVDVDSALTYTTEYHGTFSTFKVDKEGKVVTSPGPLNNESVRLQILADLFEVIKTVDSKKFLDSVKSESLLLKYEFPLEQVTEPAIRENIRKQRLTNEEYIAAIEKELISRVNERIASNVSPSEHWSFISREVDQYLDLNGFTEQLLKFRLALVVDHAGQMDRATMYEVMVDCFPAQDLTLPDDVKVLENSIRQSKLALEIFESGDFINELQNQNSHSSWGTYLDVFAGLKGLSKSQVREETFRKQVSEIKNKMNQIFDGNITGSSLSRAIYNQLSGIQKLYPVEGKQLNLNYNLQAYSLHLLGRTEVLDALKQWLQVLNLDNQQHKQSFLNAMAKSEFLRDVFYKDFQWQARKDQTLLVKYQPFHLLLTGQSKEDFIATFFSDLPMNSETELGRAIQNRLKKIDKADLEIGKRVAIQVLVKENMAGHLSDEVLARYFLTELINDKFSATKKSFFKDAITRHEGLKRIWYEVIPSLLEQTPWRGIKLEVQDMFNQGVVTEHSGKAFEAQLAASRYRLDKQIEDLTHSGNLAKVLKVESAKLSRLNKNKGWEATFALVDQYIDSRHLDLSSVSPFILSFLEEVSNVRGKKAEDQKTDLIKAFVIWTTKFPHVRESFIKEGLTRVVQEEWQWRSVSEIYKQIYYQLPGQDGIQSLTDFINRKYDFEISRNSNARTRVSFLVDAVVNAPDPSKKQVFGYILDKLINDWKQKTLDVDGLYYWMTQILNSPVGSAGWLRSETIGRLNRDHDFRGFWLQKLIVENRMNSGFYKNYRKITGAWLQIDPLQVDRMSVYTEFVVRLQSNPSTAIRELVRENSENRLSIESPAKRLEFVLDIILSATHDGHLNEEQKTTIFRSLLGHGEWNVAESQDALITFLNSNSEMLGRWKKELLELAVNEGFAREHWVSRFIDISHRGQLISETEIRDRVFKLAKKKFSEFTPGYQYGWQQNNQDNQFGNLVDSSDNFGDTLQVELEWNLIKLAADEFDKKREKGEYRISQGQIERIFLGSLHHFDLSKLNLKSDGVLSETLIKNIKNLIIPVESNIYSLTDEQIELVKIKFAELVMDRKPEEVVTLLGDLSKEIMKPRTKKAANFVNSNVDLMKKYGQLYLKSSKSKKDSHEEKLSSFLKALNLGFELSKLRVQDVTEIIHGVSVVDAPSFDLKVAEAFKSNAAITESFKIYHVTLLNRCIESLKIH